MKTKLPVTIFFIFISLCTYAQVNRCSTMEQLKEMIKKNPDIINQIKESERKTNEWLRTNPTTRQDEPPQPITSNYKNGNRDLQAICGYDNTLSSTIAAPTTLSQIVSPPGNCTHGGEYVRVTGMVAGNVYRISTCGNANFDTQIAIYTAGGGQAVGFNDDYCGSQSVIKFSPLASGDFDILIDEYGCLSNSLCASLEVQLFYMPRPVLTIPVVVHVVYKNATENISTSQINSQINVLNADFRRLNTDINSTPAAFRGLSIDPLIQFCLAQRDPSGAATTGIVRVQTTEPSFDPNTEHIKYTSLGGHDNWDPHSYLNLYVCDLQGIQIGYAKFPWQLASSPATDGVELDYTVFGTTGTATAPFDLGRNATHEIGHWLNLLHIWGGENACLGSDSVDDTPNHGSANFGVPTFPTTDACTPAYPGLMFYNYMDYCDDIALTMFTYGQFTRTEGALFNERLSLFTSVGCQPVGINELHNTLDVSLFPNPSSGVVTLNVQSPLQVSVEVFNVLGKKVFEDKIISQATIDLRNLSDGVYFIQIASGSERIMNKIIIAKSK